MRIYFSSFLPIPSGSTRPARSLGSTRRARWAAQAFGPEGAKQRGMQLGARRSGTNSGCRDRSPRKSWIKPSGVVACSGSQAGPLSAGPRTLAVEQQHGPVRFQGGIAGLALQDDDCMFVRYLANASYMATPCNLAAGGEQAVAEPQSLHGHLPRHETL